MALAVLNGRSLGIPACSFLIDAYAGPKARGLRRHHLCRPSRVLESILASTKIRTCLHMAGWLMLSWVANWLIERLSRAVKRKIWRRGSLASARKIPSRAFLLLSNIRLRPLAPLYSACLSHGPILRTHKHLLPLGQPLAKLQQASFARPDFKPKTFETYSSGHFSFSRHTRAEISAGFTPCACLRIGNGNPQFRAREAGTGSFAERVLGWIGNETPSHQQSCKLPRYGVRGNRSCLVARV